MKINIYSFSAIVLILAYFPAIAQENPVWDYPIKPGTEEWKALFTRDEMLKACQIPEEVLKSLPTQDIVIICQNYPLISNYYLYNNLQEGFRKVIPYFNGLQELLTRKDNVQCLMSLLQNYNLETLESKSQSILELGETIVKQSLIEVILSQESVLVNANSEQKKAIATIALKNMIIKGQMPQTYSHYSLEASAYLLCLNLKNLNDDAEIIPELEQFLKTGSLQNATVQIEELKLNYSKTLKIEQ